jgi:hypothetical protein
VLDGENLCANLFGWEFVGDSIPRMMFCPSEIIPEGHIIELEDHTINIKIEIFFSLECFFLKDSDEFFSSFYVKKWKITPLKSPE